MIIWKLYIMILYITILKLFFLYEFREENKFSKSLSIQAIGLYVLTVAIIIPRRIGFWALGRRWRGWQEQFHFVHVSDGLAGGIFALGRGASRAFVTTGVHGRIFGRIPRLAGRFGWHASGKMNEIVKIRIFQGIFRWGPRDANTNQLTWKFRHNNNCNLMTSRRRNYYRVGSLAQLECMKYDNLKKNVYRIVGFSR